MSSKINHLAYNQKLCIVSDKCQVNRNPKTLVKSIAYAIRYVQQYNLEDIVNGTHLHLKKEFLGRGFAKPSTSWGEGAYKQLRTNSPFNIAQLGASHA